MFLNWYIHWLYNVKRFIVVFFIDDFFFPFVILFLRWFSLVYVYVSVSVCVYVVKRTF